MRGGREVNKLTFDVIGAITGSDKSSTVRNAHDYLRHYEDAFAEYRDHAFNLIEVGIAKGASLRSWKWLFPNAFVVGVDINEQCRRYAEDRIAIEIGSQADTAFLTDLCTRHKPTIFIDDGSHLAEHNIITFEAVFPLVAQGGYYVVEDLVVHFGANKARWQLEAETDAPGYFLAIMRHRMGRGFDSTPIATPAAILNEIDAITVIGGTVLIRKRGRGGDYPTAMAVAEAYGKDFPLDPDARTRLAHYILHHGNEPARALALVQTAIAEGGTTAERACVHGHALLLTGDLDGAATCLKQAQDAGVQEIPYVGFYARRLGNMIERARARRAAG
jgi:hypothetical protein